MNERQEMSSLKNQLPEYGDLESERLKLSLSSMPAQRMAWIEEALAFSYRAGILPSIIFSRHQIS